MHGATKQKSTTSPVPSRAEVTAQRRCSSVFIKWFVLLQAQWKENKRKRKSRWALATYCLPCLRADSKSTTSAQIWVSNISLFDCYYNFFFPKNKKQSKKFFRKTKSRTTSSSTTRKQIQLTQSIFWIRSCAVWDEVKQKYLDIIVSYVNCKY